MKFIVLLALKFLKLIFYCLKNIYYMKFYSEYNIFVGMLNSKY